MIRPRRLGIASHATDAIRGLRAPTIITEIFFVVRLCIVFKRFVPNFVRLEAPLNKNYTKTSEQNLVLQTTSKLSR